MMYAKIDSQGNVIEFPYNLELIDQTLPSDVVEVDDESQKPTISWQQKLIHDRVEKEGDEYVLYYNVENRFANDDEAKEFLRKAIDVYHKQNVRTFEARVDGLVNPIPQREADSWDQQVDEARKYIADNTAEVPLIEAASTTRGITKTQYAEAILRKANAYAIGYGQLLGRFHGNQDALDAIDLNDSTTWDSFDNYHWNI